MPPPAHNGGSADTNGQVPATGVGASTATATDPAITTSAPSRGRIGATQIRRALLALRGRVVMTRSVSSGVVGRRGRSHGCGQPQRAA
jgi:hypothetical protein